MFLLVGVSNLCIFSTVFGGHLYTPPRVLAGYWSFISMVALLNFYVLKWTKAKQVLLLLVNLVTVLHIINTNVIITDLYVSNALDKEYVTVVQKYIEKYEKETGIGITTVVVSTDENCQKYWSDYVDYYNFNINERCVSETWHCNMLLNMYSGRAYSGGDGIVPDNIYEEYFKGRDWDYFNPEEQMIFCGEKVYLVVY